MATRAVAAAARAANSYNFPKLLSEFEALRSEFPRPEERYLVLIERIMAARAPDLAGLAIKLEILDLRNPEHLAAISRDVRRLADRESLRKKSASDEPRLCYSVAEANKATGISRTVLFEEIKAERLKSRRRGSSRIILTQDLHAYLAALPMA